MILEKHNTNWRLEFKRLKHVYIQTSGEYILGIEHIGSTSIPDLMAKPILDIDIFIQDYKVFPNIKNRLESLGYYHNGDQGIPYREAFKRKDEDVPYFDSEKNWMLHHLYVCPEFSTELKRHIRFREEVQGCAVELREEPER